MTGECFLHETCYDPNVAAIILLSGIKGCNEECPQREGGRGGQIQRQTERKTE